MSDTPKLNPLRKDLQDFLLYCELTKQYSDNTVRNYSNTLDRMATYFESKKIVRTQDVDLDAVNLYRQHLHKLDTIRGDKMSLRAQGYQIVVLRSFLKFMIKQGALVLSPDKLELPKTRQKRIEFLSEPEVIKLIDSILNDTTIPEILKKRNEVLIMTMFGSGLRLSEVLSLKISDTMNDDERLLIEGKGGKVRTTFLAPQAKQAIVEYLEMREDDNQFLFISHSKNRPKDEKKWKAITPRAVQQMLKQYATRMGIYKHITPHTLRHSFATKILFEGGDLRSVQTLLGHSNLSTTQVYTHITDWQIKDLHKKVFKKDVPATAKAPSKENEDPFPRYGLHSKKMPGNE
jgi:site-specific recombinase XerD